MSSATTCHARLGGIIVARMVPQVVPRIYVRNTRVPAVSGWGRLGCALVCLGCLSVLVLAAWLTPSTLGLGTHVQLGLRPCGWIVRYGLPCPGCGMTTSFAHFARGQLLSSLWVQPAGLVLAIVCAAGVWTFGYVAVSGKALFRLFRSISMPHAVAALGLLLIVGWVWKILTHQSRW